jgi:hypothetical protein
MAAIELAEMIDGLRTELEKAQKKGKEADIRFDVNNIDIEIELSIAKKVGVEGHAEAEVAATGLVKYLVGEMDGKLSIDGVGDYEKVSTQKITMSLSAKNKDGSDTRLSGSR